MRIRALSLALIFAASAIGIRIAAEGAAATHVLPPPPIGLPTRWVRMLALEHDGLVADLLWIRFVQRVPTSPADPATGQWLAQQLDGVIKLDPNFRAGYLHGSILLSVLGNQPCRAVEILEQGKQRFPDDWKLPFQIGYNCFADLGDFECAAREMKRAASIAGSPEWLPALVARLMADSSRADAAIAYLQEQLARTTDERLRARFAERLREAVLARDLDTLDGAIRRWRLAHPGDAPSSLQRLVDDGLIPFIPPNDPFGGKYLLLPSLRAGTTSGRTPLKTYNRQNAYNGDIRERLLKERVIARLPSVLGKPSWLPGLREQIASSRLESSLFALDRIARLSSDPATVEDARVLQARILMRRDIDAMREARLRLLRESPGSTPTIASIVARAGVPADDPFGSPYVLDKQGIPTPSFGRVAFAPIGARAEGGRPCP